MDEKNNNSAAHKESPAWQDAREYGIDMSLLESNLRKTPWERMRAHDRALNLALSLREAVTQLKALRDKQCLEQ